MEQHPEPTPANQQFLGDVARLCFRLGCTAFGGPAAHIAMLRHEVVERRAWISNQRFLDLMGITNLIPGPNSTEMVMHLGQERAGFRGLLAAGSAFILPAASLTLGFTWLYVEYGTTPTGSALLDGVKPVTLAVIAQAVWTLGRTVSKSIPHLILSVVVALLYLLGVNELVLLFGGAAVASGVAWISTHRTSLPALALPVGPIGFNLVHALPTDPVVGYTWWRLFLGFLKIGGLLYGSGYVLVAFVRSEFVERLGWLTEQQLLDAVAVGQFTPGPVFTTATFVGYLAGGVVGAIVATIAIFLPAFLFVALAHRLLNRLMTLAWVRPLLDGVNASAIGLMAGVGILLARDALDAWWAVPLAIAALLALLRWKINSALLIMVGAVVGLAMSLA